MDTSDNESKDPSGLITFELVRRSVSDSESSPEGIGAIYNICKTLGTYRLGTCTSPYQISIF